jgi:enoyl-CoA hydratase/carnithine racemase
MTAEMFSGEVALDLGLVTRIEPDPVSAATEFARQLAGRSPDQLAAAKRLFDRSWTSSSRRTFARERWEQVFLLAARNTKAAQAAAQARVPPVFGPRQR